MERGTLQKLNNKKSKEGLESYSKDGYHCILTKYISCTEVYVKFDDGEIKRTRFKNDYVKNNTEDFKNEVRAILKGVVI